MRTHAEVDSFGIALPPDWVIFPLEDGNFEAFVRGQRDRLRRESDLSRTAERQFEMLMRSLRNDCESTGIRMMATLLGVVDSEDGLNAGSSVETGEGKGETELVAASMTIAIVTRAEMGSDVPLTVDAIQLAMSLDRPNNMGDEEGESISNLEPPSVVAMPVGDVVKLVRLHRLKYRESRGGSEFPRELPVFVQHFFAPIDTVGSSAVVVTFTTPIVSLARPDE